eukprot:scaffold55939_cov54-Phaeocystis_antarctica.AAC.2
MHALRKEELADGRRAAHQQRCRLQHHILPDELGRVSREAPDACACCQPLHDRQLHLQGRPGGGQLLDHFTTRALGTCT